MRCGVFLLFFHKATHLQFVPKKKHLQLKLQSHHVSTPTTKPVNKTNAQQQHHFTDEEEKTQRARWLFIERTPRRTGYTDCWTGCLLLDEFVVVVVVGIGILVACLLAWLAAPGSLDHLALPCRVLFETWAVGVLKKKSVVDHFGIFRKKFDALHLLMG